MGTGAPAAGRESSAIAEKGEHCAGQHPGGGADKRQLASFSWWPRRRRPPPWTPAFARATGKASKLVLFDQPRPLRKNLPGKAPVGSPFSKVI